MSSPNIVNNNNVHASGGSATTSTSNAATTSATAAPAPAPTSASAASQARSLHRAQQLNARDNMWYFTAEQLANSPSLQNGIDSDQERYFRQSAAYLIQEMGQRLHVAQLCINTAIVYMHRFYAFHSFTNFHRNSIASAALFLAAKVEEQPRKLEHVIRASQKCLGTQHTETSFSENSQDLVFHENLLLQTLGFDVAIVHPHTHVVQTCQIVKACKDITQTAYFLASNSLHLTNMCLRYKPTVVACFCIHLACKWSGWALAQSGEGKDWFSYVDKTVSHELLEQMTEEFISICDKSPTRLKSKLNSIRAIATNRSTQERSKEEWKVADMMKGYHSTRDSSTSGNKPEAVGAAAAAHHHRSHNNHTTKLPYTNGGDDNKAKHAVNGGHPHRSSSTSSSSHQSSSNRSQQSSSSSSLSGNQSSGNFAQPVRSHSQGSTVPAPEFQKPSSLPRHSSAAGRSGLSAASHQLPPPSSTSSSSLSHHQTHASQYSHKMLNSKPPISDANSNSSTPGLGRPLADMSSMPKSLSNNKIYPPPYSSSGNGTTTNNQQLSGATSQAQLNKPAGGNFDDMSRSMQHQQRPGHQHQSALNMHRSTSNSNPTAAAVAATTSIANIAKSSSVHNLSQPSQAPQISATSSASFNPSIVASNVTVKTEPDDIRRLWNSSSSGMTSLFDPEYEDRLLPPNQQVKLNTGFLLASTIDATAAKPLSPIGDLPNFLSPNETPANAVKKEIKPPTRLPMGYPPSSLSSNNNPNQPPATAMNSLRANQSKSVLPGAMHVPSYPASTNAMERKLYDKPPSGELPSLANNFKRPFDAASFSKLDDSSVLHRDKFRKLDSNPSSGGNSSSGLLGLPSFSNVDSKLPLKKHLDTTPDVVRSIINESLSNSKPELTLLKKELPSPGPEPPTELFAPMTTATTAFSSSLTSLSSNLNHLNSNINSNNLGNASVNISSVSAASSGVINNVNSQPTMTLTTTTTNAETPAEKALPSNKLNVEETAASQDGKEKKKKKKDRKHKEKEKDKDKDREHSKSKHREERKKHKKDKDKRKDRSRDSDHDKSIRPCTVLEDSPGSLKLKIRGIPPAATTSSAMLPPASEQNPQSLRIKITKDRLETYQKGVNTSSSSSSSSTSAPANKVSQPRPSLPVMATTQVAQMQPPQAPAVTAASALAPVAYQQQLHQQQQAHQQQPNKLAPNYSNLYNMPAGVQAKPPAAAYNYNAAVNAGNAAVSYGNGSNSSSSSSSSSGSSKKRDRERDREKKSRSSAANSVSEQSKYSAAVGVGMPNSGEIFTPNAASSYTAALANIMQQHQQQQMQLQQQQYAQQQQQQQQLQAQQQQQQNLYNMMGGAAGLTTPLPYSTSMTAANNVPSSAYTANVAHMSGTLYGKK